MIRKLNLNYQRYYNRWHIDTNEHRVALSAHHHALLDSFLENIRKGCALDMGCGMGFTLTYLHELGFNQVVGYDADEEQIKICKKHGLQAIKAEELDDLLKIFQGPFTVVTALDFLEHLPIDVALMTVRRVYNILEPGGIFICTVPNANSVLEGRWRYNDFTHHTSYTEHSLDFLLFNAGFHDIQILPAELPRNPSIYPFKSKKFLNWINFKLTRGLRRLQCIAELGNEGKTIPLSLNLLGIAKK